MEVGKVFRKVCVYYRSTYCHISDVSKLHHWNSFPFDTTTLLCSYDDDDDDDDDDEYLEHRDSEGCGRLRLHSRVNFGKTGFEYR
jgi:hypothetical protein